jgi:septum formation protein
MPAPLRPVYNRDATSRAPPTMPHTDLVLASTSPFRRALLQRLGLPFNTAAPLVDEIRKQGEAPAALVTRLAEAKARAVAAAHPDALIIGSDQVAAIDDTVMGKPGDREGAIAQLNRASGRTVVFYTGLCLLNASTGHIQVACEPFRVHFRRLTQGQIAGYVDQEQPFNCAGSFRSEGLGIALFDRLEGNDPSALIGLPLIRLIAMLGAEGVDLLASPHGG